MDLIFLSLQFSTQRLICCSLLSNKRFVTLLRCRYGPTYGNDKLQKHQKVVTKVCAMSSHVSHPLPGPPSPPPLSTHYNRYQNTSLLPTATFTTVSTPNSHSHDILPTWLCSKSDATVSVPYTYVTSPFAYWWHCAKNVFQSLRLDWTTGVTRIHLQALTQC
jgi:hypothetical protein